MGTEEIASCSRIVGRGTEHGMPGVEGVPTRSEARHVARSLVRVSALSLIMQEC